MQMIAGNHMTEFTAIAPESHAKKVWKKVSDYAFAAKNCSTISRY